MIRRPDMATGEFEGFIGEGRQWVSQVAEATSVQRTNELARLVAAGDYRAAVIAAISMLEIFLRKHLKAELNRRHLRCRSGSWLSSLKVQGLLSNTLVERIREWMKLRNNVVHSTRTVTRAHAVEIVQGVASIVNRRV